LIHIEILDDHQDGGMFAQLTSGMDFHGSALIVRAERQRTIASNIANADTPGMLPAIWISRTPWPTRGENSLATGPAGDHQRSSGSHPCSISPGPPGDGCHRRLPARWATPVQTQPAMDNNSVDLDRERANFVDNAVRYETTLRFH
jgi:flagellar basal-body rod protein FlgB